MKKGWTEVALGEVLESVSRTVRVEPDESYRLLGVRLEGKGAFHRETKLGGETSASALDRVQNGDFIYSRLFAWRGAFSLIGPELDGAFVSNEFPIFAARKPERIDLRYLNYWFRQSRIWKIVEEDCQGSTPVTRNRYKEEFFNVLRITLPPLAEQQRVVAHLNTIETSLTRARKLRAEQEYELQAALRSAFHRLEAHAEWVVMSEVAPLVRREVEIDAEGSYPELGIRSFGRGTFHKPNVLGIETTKRLFAIHAGDLVFNNVFAWEGAVAVAQPDDHGRVGSHRFITCVCDPVRVLPEFLQFYFLTKDGLDKLGKASPGGAGRNRTLGIEKLARIQAPLVSLGQQVDFKKLLDHQAKLRAEATQSEQRAAALLPSLLDALSPHEHA